VAELKGRGQRALAVLEGASLKVDEAFAAFAGAAHAAAGIETVEQRLRDGSLSISAAAQQVKEERLASEWRYPCLWLEDAKYRAVVTACRWSFVECEGLLKDLFQRAHETERARRQAALEVLADLLSKEKALWTALPAELADATAQLEAIICGSGNGNGNENGNGANGSGKGNGAGMGGSFAAEVSADVRRSLAELVESIRKEDADKAALKAPKAKPPAGGAGGAGGVGADAPPPLPKNLPVPHSTAAAPQPPPTAGGGGAGGGAGTAPGTAPTASAGPVGSVGHQPPPQPPPQPQPQPQPQLASIAITAGGAPGPAAKAHLAAMESPLRSPLVLHAEVLERRKEGTVYGGTWVPALAVVTCDKHLHLFDLPKVRACVRACVRVCVAMGWMEG
jgi:hypothetical protein